MTPRPVAALLGLGLSACSQHAFVALPIVAGDVLVAAVLDESHEAVEVRRVDSSGAMAELEAPPEGSTAIFHLRRSHFVDEGGQPLADGTWQTFEAVRAVDEGMLGKCQRCQVPSPRAPQTVIPGDRCRVPAWAEGGLSAADEVALTESDRAALLEIARAQIELGFGGDCDCSKAVAPVRANLEVCPVDAPIPSLAARFLAIDDAGTVFGATPGFVLRAPVAGPALIRPVLPAARELQLLAPTPNGGVLLISSEQTLFSASPAVVRYFDADLIEHPVVGTPPVRPAVAMFTAPDRFVIVGRRARSTSFFDCRASFGATSLSFQCSELSLESSATCPLLNLQAYGRHFFEGPNGEELVLTALGVVAQRDPISSSLRCLPMPARSESRWTLSATVTIESPEITGAHSLEPDSFFAVVHAGGDIRNGEVQTALVHGRVDRSPDGTAVAVDFRLLDTVLAPDLRGIGLHPIPGDPPRIAAVRARGGEWVATVYDANMQRLSFEPAWNRPSPPRALLPEVTGVIDLLRVSRDRRWFVLRDLESQLYRASATDGRLSSLGARDERLSDPIGVIAELDEESVLAVTATRLLRVSPGPTCGDDTIEPLGFEGRLPAIPTAAVRMPGPGQNYVVLGNRELGRIDLATGTARLLPHLNEDATWVDAAPLNPDALVLLDDRGRLYLLDSEDGLSPIASAPAADDAVPYLSLGGRGGAIFAGGHGRLDRVRLVSPSEVRVESVLENAERTDWDALESDRRGPPFILGVGARCRSEAMIHTFENLNIGAGLSISDTTRMFALEADTSRVTVRNPASFENFSDALPTEEGIVAKITWLDGTPLTVFPHGAGTFVYTFGTEARALPFNAVTGAVRGGDWIMVAAGRLTRLEDESELDAGTRLRRFSAEGFRLAKLRRSPTSDP